MSSGIAVLALLAAIQSTDVTIAGVVLGVDGAEPIPHVEVRLADLGVRTTTDLTGRYTFASVPRGWHQLEFSHLGYQRRTLRYRVGDAGGGLDVTLAVDPIVLAPIELDARGVKTPTLEVSDLFRAQPMSSRQLREHPLAGSSDPLEVASTVNGVLRMPGTLGVFHVRGGSADQNVLLLDGAPILSPYHMLGLSSVVNPDIVDGLTFHTGIVPARHGGRLSGILEIEGPSLRSSPSPSEWRIGMENYAGRATVRDQVLGAGYQLSVRRSFGGPLAARSQEHISRALFHDVFAKVSVPIAGGTLEVFTLHASDELQYSAHTGPEEPRVGAAPTSNAAFWSTSTQSLRWVGAADDALEVVAYHAVADVERGWDPLGSPVALQNETGLWGLQATVSTVTDRGHLEWGGSLARDAFAYVAIGEAGTMSRGAAGTRVSAFASDTRRVTDWLTTSVGVRATGRKGASLGLEPRLSLAWRASSRIAAGVAFGRSTQDLQSLRNEESLASLATGVDLFGVATADVGEPASSSLWTGVVEARLPLGLVFNADLYYRELEHLVQVAPTTGDPFSVAHYAVGSGVARGVGLGVSHDRDRVSLRVGYHLGTTSRATSSVAYQPAFHRDHWFRSGLRFDWTARTSFRVVGSAGSGSPTSAHTSAFEFETPDALLGEGKLWGTPRREAGLNTLRTPRFFQVDVGVRHTRVWTGGKPRRLSLYAGLSNALDREHTLTFARTSSGSLVPVPFGQVGIRAGLEWAF